MVKMFMVGIVYRKVKSEAELRVAKARDILGFKVVDYYSKRCKMMEYSSIHDILSSGGIVGNLTLNSRSEIEAYPEQFDFSCYTQYDEKGRVVGDARSVVISYMNMATLSWAENACNRIVYYSNKELNISCTTCYKYEIEYITKHENFSNLRVDTFGNVDYDNKFISDAVNKLEKYKKRLSLIQSNINIEMDELGGITKLEGSADQIDIFFGTYIADRAMKGIRCKKLVLRGGIEVINRIDSSDNMSLSEVVIGDGVVSLSSMCFAGSDLEKISLPETLSIIGDGAFQNCSNLKYLEIPSKVANLPKRLCSFCQSLETVKIGNNSASMSEYSFNGCYSLKYIVLNKDISDENLEHYRNLVEELIRGRYMPKNVQIVRDR